MEINLQQRIQFNELNWISSKTFYTSDISNILVKCFAGIAQ